MICFGALDDRAPAKNGIVAALDLASSKVCCLIARLAEDQPPEVIGIGQQASHGVRGGAVVDMEATERAVANAVHAAEQMVGQTIDRVVVNLSGGHPQSASIDVKVSISGHAVGDSDLRRSPDSCRHDGGQTAPAPAGEGGAERPRGPIGYWFREHL